MILLAHKNAIREYWKGITGLRAIQVSDFTYGGNTPSEPHALVYWDNVFYVTTSLHVLTLQIVLSSRQSV